MHRDKKMKKMKKRGMPQDGALGERQSGALPLFFFVLGGGKASLYYIIS
jgi:hypothetical protein